MPDTPNKYLPIMEGCCWGCGVAVLFTVLFPSAWIGGIAAFVLLLAVFVWATIMESRNA